MSTSTCFADSPTAYVSIRQHTYVGIRQYTSAYVVLPLEHLDRLRLQPYTTPGYVRIHQDTSRYVKICQDTSVYVRIRQDTSVYVSIRQDASAYVTCVGKHAYLRSDVRPVRKAARVTRNLRQ